ncbi:MAG: M23 family metallopeptidase, partial [Myxococcales bacterium]|nr:M23 family metallopeptidase [Myxococcales bacterium]
ASAPTPTPPSPSAPAPRPLGKGAPASGGSGGMLWPVAGGTLSSRFGPRGGRPHEGIDIAAPAGSAVRAAAAGVVIYAGAGIRGYGNLVIVRHRRLVTVYAHNRKNLVRRGTRVARGDVVAEVGSSGRATGNHLHFEVRVGETPRDPLRYVQPAGGAAK